MKTRHKALSVHLLTATGAVLSMLAMLAAVEGKWSLMFLWLVVALVVDGIDGPLARRYDVKIHSPNYDGVLMDLIIDYLTYVFIPAYALFKSGLLSGWTGWWRCARPRRRRWGTGRPAVDGGVRPRPGPGAPGGLVAPAVLCRGLACDP